MSSVLLGRSLDRLIRRTPLGQPDSETWTGQTILKILTWKLKLNKQQSFWASLTLSEIKSTAQTTQMNFLIWHWDDNNDVLWDQSQIASIFYLAELFEKLSCSAFYHRFHWQTVLQKLEIISVNISIISFCCKYHIYVVNSVFSESNIAEICLNTYWIAANQDLIIMKF